MIAVVGFVLLGVVGGLAFIMAQGAGTPAGTMSALASPAVPPTASPTASPTPDLRETAASEFRAFEDEYLDAYNALHDTLPTTGQFASYAQAQSYYGTEVQNLRRFEASLRGMTFPTDVDPDAQTLLERISRLATLMDKLAATKKEATGWEINKKILKARDALHAARVVVGTDLGLGYAATPKPTVKPTAKPTPKAASNATPKPTAKPTPKATRKPGYGPTPKNSITLNGTDGIWGQATPAFHLSRIRTDLVATSDGSGQSPLEPVRYGDLLAILYRFDTPKGALKTVTFEVYSSCPAGHQGAGLYLLDSNGSWGDRIAWANCKTGWHSVTGPADGLVYDGPYIDGLVMLRGWDLDGIRISKARIVWTYAP